MNQALPLTSISPYSYFKDLLIGLFPAIIVCGVVSLLPPRYAIDFFAAFLALTAAGYFGSALTEGKVTPFVAETLVALAVFVAALAGLWHSPVWLAVGYFAHGLWDVFHCPHRFGARVTMLWFPPACLMYDWVVALFILITLV